MSGHRIERLNADIQKELADIIRELKDPRVKGLLSVVKVSVSGDLSYAEAYISDAEGIVKTKEAVEGLDHGKGFIKRELGQRLRLKKTPELRFIADDSIACGAEISRRIRELNSGFEPQE
ncbi:MAG: 30S ribosome-binding factor RbfA [Oscillospiraceae bacterium]|jgi:ribosome-binding factor A|nr:30S ribosome-binding factor RbfA [Oscillospiraceae bacterium]